MSYVKLEPRETNPDPDILLERLLAHADEYLEQQKLIKKAERTLIGRAKRALKSLKLWV